MPKQLPPIINTFYFRLGLFFLVFIAITGIIGPYVISTNLLYGFYFFIYGNLGKLVLFVCVALFLLLRNKKITLPPISSSWQHIFYIIAGLLFIPVFFWLSAQVLRYSSFSANSLLAVLLHIVLLSIPVLLAMGIFTPVFIRKSICAYWKFICLGIIAGICYDVSIFYIWKLWPFFSNTVLIIMKVLFSLSQHPVYVISPRTLFVRNFAVTIAEACSGIDSMYLLLTLYLLIIGMDWKVLQKRKIVLYFFPLFIGMFIINILRVYLLIWLGLLLSPGVTFALFHTYIGLVLFMLYFLGFLYVIYPKMKLSQK